MKKIFYSTLFILAFFTKNTFACDCFYIDNFCGYITSDNDGEIHPSYSVYHVKIIGTNTDGVEVEILKTFHGDDKEGQEVFMPNGDGANCQIFTDGFAVGEEYIVAASFYNDEMYISICGVSYLKIENDMVIGQINPEVDQIALTEFTTVMDCGEMSVTSTTETANLYELTVTPTLAKNNVSVKTTTADYLQLEVAVFDASGKMVYKKRQEDFSVNTELNIDIGSWSSGIYFFRMNVNGAMWTEKIIK